MKKLFLTFCATAFALSTLFAQAPDAFNYQAVARDVSGDVIGNQMIGMLFEVHLWNGGGPVIYSETHSTTTNEHGLFNLYLGVGSVVSGNFGDIDWSNGPFHLEVSIDPLNSSNYQSMGTQPWISVPFAKFADKATELAYVPNKVFALSNFSFQHDPENTANMVIAANNVYVQNSLDAPGSLYAPINLPHEAIIDSIRSVYYDNSTSDLVVSIERVFVSNLTTSTVATFTSSGTPGQSDVYFHPSGSTIDNIGYSYHLRLTTTAGWDFTFLSFNQLKIFYH